MNIDQTRLSRREMLRMATGIGGLSILGSATSASGSNLNPGPITINAKPFPMTIDPGETAILVIDMQNDFASEGGMFQRDGRDLTFIRASVGPTAKVLELARKARIKIIYFKMAFKPDLSDIGSPDSVNRRIHLKLGAGRSVQAPDGSESRILVRDTWNSNIITELLPRGDDIVRYKTRFDAFHATDLDALLKQAGIKYIILTGCATSTCIESTARDSMFRDYLPLVLSDCTGDLNKEFHEGALMRIERLFGWTSTSTSFLKGLAAQ